MDQSTMNSSSEVSGPKRNVPRDVFLHLLAMVTLYWSAISFITLCWQYINYWFPDILRYDYGFNGSMRFAMASLFIVFPVFIIVSYFLNKIYAKESGVRESKIRKWLIYLTLFVAALVIIGDLIFVINNFLGGEITMRFILKALSVLITATVIFGYYLDDVRRNTPSSLTKYFAWASCIVVALGLGFAFLIVGSPVNARLYQIDQQKISDLQQIQYQVVMHWQRKGELPKTLADLQDPISGYIVPTDPETNQPYGYNITDASALAFQVCAKFNLSAQNMPGSGKTPVPAIYPGNEFSEIWDHEAGYVCFDRSIDKQLYPLSKP